MDVSIIIEYLQCLIDDILSEKENKRFLAHKIKVLMSRLELVEKEEKKIKKLEVKSKTKKIENFSYFT